MKACLVAPIAAAVLVAIVTGAAAQVPCANDFLPLRAEAEKRAGAIKAAAERKAPPQELCPLFRRFSEAEGKMVKFVEQNLGFCQIPPQAAEAMKANHAHTLQTQQRVCAAAANVGPDGAPRSRGPTLGDSLGVGRVPSADSTTTGRGTFDTLTGTNPVR
jgi:hypothetical protein